LELQLGLILSAIFPVELQIRITLDMIIRKARQDDLPAILELVYELATYENARNQVVASLNDYKQGFDEALFDAFVAENSKAQIVGTCIYYLTWSTWKGKMFYLEDFVVREEQRQAGVGQQLFDATIAEAKKLDCALIKWQVLDWNIPAIKFYEKNRAIFEKDWWNGKLLLS
jgi:GNAT superfamily N-acetyltransferase